MEIYDSLHGVIEIDLLAKKIIDTEEFQRLRNIKQLGFCYHVFPGASHNRFEHSIGVYHLTRKYIHILNKRIEHITEYEIKLLTTAALIHDLGHGPFSHLFDETVNKEKNHEYRSVQLFKQINKRLDLKFTENDIETISNIIKPKSFPKNKKYLYQIISNPNGIDVDRFDYLMRDIKMIGLNYGIEYERIMKHSMIIHNEIVYSSKVKTHIEDFFRTRFIMYKEVYNHKTVRSIEYMMKQFLIHSDKIYGIRDIINGERWSQFIQLTDSIIDLVYFLPINSEIRDLIYILDCIKTRKINKSCGEIYTLKDIDIINHDENIIIDKILLKYYGNEKCKYYDEINTSNSIDFNYQNEYLIRIYYKKNKYKEEAENVYSEIIKKI